MAILRRFFAWRIYLCESLHAIRCQEELNSHTTEWEETNYSWHNCRNDHDLLQLRVAHVRIPAQCLLVVTEFSEYLYHTPFPPIGL